mgnify:CR=1 FL=1
MVKNCIHIMLYKVYTVYVFFEKTFYSEQK